MVWALLAIRACLPFSAERILHSLFFRFPVLAAMEPRCQRIPRGAIEQGPLVVTVLSQLLGSELQLCLHDQKST